MQYDNHPQTGDDPEARNAFGVFVLVFDEAADTYQVRGTAFESSGAACAEWWFDEYGLRLTPDRLTASYDFVGKLLGEDVGTVQGSQRQGNTRLLFDPDRLSGGGEVGVIGGPGSFGFSLQKITDDWLNTYLKDSGVTPEMLLNKLHRKRFGESQAEVLSSLGASTSRHYGGDGASHG